MFESKAFYQAYCHVLKRIKNLLPEELPFENIMINFNPEKYRDMRNQYIPDYCKGTMIYNKSPFYPIKNNWPSYLKDNLDKSQFHAVRYSLLNKVALIQGPPGTGKTYVGTLICKILMESTKNPILIVCYTNHALDQFLGHIYKYEKNVLRIGGGCKDEEMMKLTLASRRRENFSKNRNFTSIKSSITTKRNIINISKEIDDILSIANKKKGLSYEELALYYPYILEKIFTDFSNNVLRAPKINQKNKIIIEKELEKFKKSIIYAWMNLVDLKKLVEEISFKLNLNFQEKMVLLDFYNITQKDSYENSTRIIDENLQTPSFNEEDNEDIFEEIQLDEDEEENYDRIVCDTGYDDLLIHQENMNSNERANFIHDEKFYEKEENLNHIASDKIYFEKKLLNEQNIWLIGKDRRYRIVLIMKDKIWELMDGYSNKLEELNDLIKKKTELENLQDLEIIKSCKIVGMTTTGCAKYSSYLDNVDFETIIVEEAAEVIESHMVTLLTCNTKHLIMIGDHLQLRPKIYNFEIENKYKFNISLFERLINNKYPIASLSYQRRMRPEFADFVRLIYGNNYYDDNITFTRNPIKGFYMDNQNYKNMIFFNHKNNENSIGGLSSKANKFEADFICYWAKYLVQQNIPEEKITILTFYVGQLLKIKETINNLKLKNIRISSVDNYQGEENDYILLSLVRSNNENNMGFLKIRNRICVAISRAKLGFFVIGDFNFLKKASQHEKNKANDQSGVSLWEKIFNLASANKILVDDLKICCQKHKNITYIKTKKDFNNIPEGGCKEICKERMDCGHICELFCHNFPHESVKCNKPCEKIIEGCRHKCLKKCHEECKNCLFIVDKKLPCGHIMKSECSKSSTKISCKNKCEKNLNCGHKCRNMCNQTCSIVEDCIELKEKILICGHKDKIPCNMVPELYQCKEKCSSILEVCSHNCKGTCGECMQGTLHVKCLNICDRNLTCGHICKKTCSDNCLCEEKCQNNCRHGDCGQKCMVECVNCIERCYIRCMHNECNNLCCQECEINPCQKRCSYYLNCNHRCLGVCGEKCPKVCKICDPENEAFQIYFGNENDDDALFYELDCGHIIEVQALDKWLEIKEIFKRPNCPKCKSPILTSNRYFNQIKYFYEQLNKIKKIYLSNIDTNYQNGTYIKDINITLKELDNKFGINNGNYIHFNDFINSCKNLNKKDYHLLVTAKNMLTLFEKMLLIEKIFIGVQEGNKGNKFFKMYNNHYLSLVKRFEKISFMKKEDFNRLSLKIDSIYYTVLILEKYDNYKDSIYYNYLLSEKLMIKNNYDLENFRKNFGEIEKKKIIEIINVLSGMKFYICPNRHIYGVGNCGQPMEEAICPECESIIGGRNHNLDVNNRQFDPNNFNI